MILERVKDELQKAATDIPSRLTRELYQDGLEAVGGGQFEELTVRPVSAEMREGHLEFLTAYRSPSRTDATAPKH